MNVDKLHKRYVTARDVAFVALEDLIKARTDNTVEGAQKQYEVAARERDDAWTAYNIAQTSETEESHRKAQG